MSIIFVSYYMLDLTLCYSFCRDYARIYDSYLASGTTVGGLTPGYPRVRGLIYIDMQNINYWVFESTGK